MKYISAKGLSAAVVRKCLIRTSVQTAPFYFGQLLRPHGIKSGIRKKYKSIICKGWKGAAYGSNGKKIMQICRALH